MARDRGRFEEITADCDAAAPVATAIEPPRLLYAVEEVAYMLGMSRAWVYEHLIGTGVLPSVYLGRRRLVRYSDIVRYVEAREVA